MFIPSAQTILTAGLAAMRTGTGPRVITEGSVLDFAVERCVDAEGRTRCSAPFAVAGPAAGGPACYDFAWHTEGPLTHTTAEVRDAASGALVFYRDTDGEWRPEKGELVYLDFKPKVPSTGNQTVHYKVTTCE
ncbi:hypothetical protein GGS23DRAFT_600345 [Durotheca rogersii]|uniref:uncharacterized protein n=1 Tax=Durotheca rogersii TaxID=419775 RepID=UPI00221EC987|nr:uncharacterized protein GGS23DRAFT_600345 [Durotheca rogersii]KAI5859420.1 hypothetical protein GGS23DRAFT_600345 [Durotheca rogersii]